MKNGCSEVQKPSYPPFLWPPQWKSPTPLQNRDRVLVVGDLLLGAAPSAAHHHPPQLRLTSAQWHRLLCFFSDQWSSPNGYCAEIVPIKNFLPNLTRFLFTVPRKTTPDMYTFLETCLFTSTTRGTMPKLWCTKKCYKRYFDQISFRESRQKPWEWKCLNRSWAITSDSSFPCSGQLE